MQNLKYLINNRIAKKTYFILLHLFACIGLFLTVGFVAVKYGWTNTEGIIDRQSELFGKNNINSKNDNYAWVEGDEWQNFSQAIIKDLKVLKRVESETGVQARLIISPVFVEQMRLYHTDRALFKSLFSPLKILGTQTQFSLGVSGIKQETAEQIERNLKDKNSIYYLGKEFEHYLDFNTNDFKNERFVRLTDYKDRYYSYLYTALYLKQLQYGWKVSGFDISDRPDIIATLFNIGFKNSIPKSDAKVGGAEIDIAGQVYSFGGLAGEFYESTNLQEFFPKK